MPGLLDLLSSDDGRLGLSLLAAAGPSTQPMGFGQRLQGAMGSFDAQKQDQLRSKFVQSQIDENAVQVAQRQAAVDGARRKQDALPGLFGGGLLGGAPGGQGGAPAGLNVQAALAAGYSPDEIQKLDALRNVGMNKVARTVKATGPDGKEYEYQMDDFGRPVGAPMAQYRAPMTVNQGSKTTFLDPYSLSPVSSLQTFQSPDSVASVGATIRGQNMLDERSRSTAEAGSVPSGYRRKMDGSGLEYIPGGPADPNTPKSKANLTEDQGKATGWLVQAENAWKNMQAVGLSPDGKVKGAAKPGINDVLATGGVVGDALANSLRGAGRQKYMQASSSLSEALLRAATGAGVNQQEAAQKIKEITPVFGDTDENIKQKMDAIPLYLESLRVRAGPGAVKADSIGGGAPLAPKADKPPAPMKGMTRGGYKFKGGDPADQANWEKI